MERRKEEEEGGGGRRRKEEGRGRKEEGGGWGGESMARGKPTFFQPMTSAFSRKSRRVIIRPYFLMIPCWEPEHLRTNRWRHPPGTQPANRPHSTQHSAPGARPLQSAHSKQLSIWQRLRTFHPRLCKAGQPSPDCSQGRPRPGCVLWQGQAGLAVRRELHS